MTINTQILQFLAKTFKFIPYDTVSPDRTDIDNNNYLIQHGILIDNPNVKLTTNQAQALVEILGINMRQLNATFFKTFDEIDKTDDAYRLLVQWLHYASTYGEITELRNGETIFEPSPEQIDVIQQYTNRVIKLHVASTTEIKEALDNYVTSGIAIPSDDIPIIAQIYREFELECPENIQNKELVTYLTANGTLKATPESFIRTAVYLLTDNTQVVKNQKLFDDILANATPGRQKELTRVLTRIAEMFTEIENLQLLADYYRKDKTIYLLIRRLAKYANTPVAQSVVKTINKIKRLSDKSHKSAKPTNIFELSNYELDKVLRSMNNFQLVRVLNLCNERLSEESDTFTQAYRIRNGKTFIRIRNGKTFIKELTPVHKSRAELVQYAVTRTLRDRYANKQIKVYLPDQPIQLTVPTSAKQFIGDVPVGSYIKVPIDFMVGVSWNTPCDFDLHAHYDGRHVGWYSDWDSRWGNSQITYTGDMTRTNKYGFAAEFMRIKNSRHIDRPLTLSVNPYCVRHVRQDSTLSFVVAHYSDTKADRQHLVDAEDIIYSFNHKVTDEKDCTFAIYDDGRITFTDQSTSRAMPHTMLNELLGDAIARKAKSALTLDSYLTMINAKRVAHDEIDEDTLVFDQDTLSIDTFIKLLA